MPTSPLHATLADLDRRIAALTKLKADLLAVLRDERDPPRPVQSTKPRRRSRHGTSKQRIAAYLTSHGPAARKDIDAAIKIKRSVIAWALSDKRLFVRDGEGKWTATGEAPR